MRIIVCGGRDYKEVAAVEHVLHATHRKYTIGLIIEGGASGADRLARQWAEKNAIPVQTVLADWGKYGRAAGPIRNAKMLELNPDGVIAFPGGRGTADMVHQARDAGVKVWAPFGVMTI